MTAGGETILVVEDDAKLRELFRVSLPAQGYTVVAAANGEDALRLAAERRPHIVILDLGLPGMDGLEVARRLRGWSAMPIIVVSARGQERQKIEALDAGADDYLTKPFSFEELLARIRAGLRRAERAVAGAEAPVRHIGPLTVDHAAHQVRMRGVEVRLSPTEFRLLAVLAEQPGRVVTQRRLCQAVWGRAGDAEARSLRVYMSYLRRKLEPEPARPVLVQTEAGVGYRLVSDDAV